mmetsp:Transcript_113002/g.196182  ORF Transcript_113002/g.196182 Transcript_113002/m.196182 type:complete len:98 (+) Transcript_113002:55-348(+)
MIIPPLEKPHVTHPTCVFSPNCMFSPIVQPPQKSTTKYTRNVISYTPSMDDKEPLPKERTRRPTNTCISIDARSKLHFLPTVQTIEVVHSVYNTYAY